MMMYRLKIRSSAADNSTKDHVMMKEYLKIAPRVREIQSVEVTRHKCVRRTLFISLLVSNVQQIQMIIRGFRLEFKIELLFRFVSTKWVLLVDKAVW